MAKNMTEGKPINLIISFAFPMLIGNIFQQFYNLVDAAIVGKYVSANALAAVGATGSTTLLLLSLIMGLTNGASIIMSQCYGSGFYRELRRSVTALIYIVGIIAIIISVFGFFASGHILKLLNTPPEILHDSTTYLKIMFLGVTSLALFNGCSALLRSLGDSKTPLMILIIASIINIGLDLLFVLKFNMGVMGVGLATLISQFVSALICLTYIIKHRNALHIDNIPRFADKEMVKKVFKLGIPTAFQGSLIALGGMSVQSLINSFGAVTVAAYTASSKIDSMAIQPIVSIATALSVFTGQNMGADNTDRIKKGLKQTLLVMLCLCVTLAVTILIFRTQILSLFLDRTEASESIRIGSIYLSIIGIAYISAGVMQSFLNVLRGAGDVNFSMVAGIVELITRIVFAYLLSHIMGTSTGIWIATPISWITACVITVIRYRTGKWTKKKVI